MIRAMAGISDRRDGVRRRIAVRQMELRHRRHELTRGVKGYLGTPRSLVHAFLAGFLLDQSRAVVRDSPRPSSLLLPLLIRFL